MFILLVGGPGAGKTPAINPVRKLIRSNPKLNVSADSLTKAGFFDAMESAAKKIPLGGQFIEFASLAVIADELGMFMSAYDKDFVSSITGAYDGRDVMGEQRRASLGARKRVDIINPLLNILAGSQPGFMTDLLPDEVWNMGFTARIVMVYSAERQYPDLTFGALNGDDRPGQWRVLMAEILRMSKLFGAFTWEPDAAKELAQWVKAGCYPEPEHHKLIWYNPKRGVHVSKLAMLSCASRGDTMVITLRDLERARNWLLHVETLMPSIFRDMKGKSDSQVLNECFQHLWRLYAADRKAIHEAAVLAFLMDRTPSQNVPRLLELLEKTGMVSRDFGTKLYTPRPKHLHGME
jgi:hypothetical protein